MLFELDLKNFFVLLSLATHAVLFWILSRYGRDTKGAKEYSVAILTIVGWIIPMIFYRDPTASNPLFWAVVLYMMATFTSPAFLYFTLAFHATKAPPRWVRFFLVIETALVNFLILHPSAVIGGIIRTPGMEPVLMWGPLYPLFMAHISLPFLIGFYVLYKKRAKLRGRKRDQIKFILIGYFIGSTLAMITNMTLPYYGYFELNWLGQFLSTIIAVFTTYTILKHKLLDISLIATEAFVILLNFFFVVQVLTSIDTGFMFFIHIIMSILVIFFSRLTINSAKEEVRQRKQLAKLTKSLESANEKLKEVDRQKTEFVSIVSHQLRAPLTATNGYISMLLEGDLGKLPDKVNIALEKLSVIANSSKSLIEDLLNMSRIESGKIQYDMQTISFSELTQSIYDELKFVAFEKKLDFVIEKPKKDIKVVADINKLRQVIVNITDNAIKYTPEGTVKLSLGLENKGKNLIFTVKDSGLGITAEELDYVFKKFSRSGTTKHIKGNGLGLYIAKQFIEAHDGGEIWVASEGEGKGALFGIRMNVVK